MSVEYLAGLLKDRNNPAKIGVVVGKIVEANPEKEYAKISILDGLIQKDKFYSTIQSFSKNDIGKNIVVAVSENNQELFVLGYFKEFFPLKE